MAVSVGRSGSFYGNKMHEMSYVVRFADMAMEALSDEPDAMVDTLTVEVGAMTGVVPEYLIKYYPKAVEGTRLEGSRLEVKMQPVVARCTCGNEYEPGTANDYRCPVCKSAEAVIIHGRELNLLNLTLS